MIVLEQCLAKPVMSPPCLSGTSGSPSPCRCAMAQPDLPRAVVVAKAGPGQHLLLEGHSIFSCGAETCLVQPGILCVQQLQPEPPRVPTTLCLVP